MLRLAPTAAGGRTVLALAALLTLAGFRLAADTPKAEPVKKDAPALPTGIIPAQAWKAAPATPLQPGEIDALLEREMKKAGVRPAPLTTDEQFLRRVSLDLTGKLPAPADVTAFLADRSPDKRAKLIDRLLDSPEFAAHWARYWREVISSRTTDFRGRVFARGFEKWLAGQLQKDASWADVARAMLTAGGQMRFDDPDKNAVGYFLASRTGADAVPERAAETSRVFLGIQIQCAQCHDHPSDVWKRE
jgi:Protein of unknown function (DUF1549)